MKKTLLTATLLAGFAASMSVYGQGTILLDNTGGGMIYLGADTATPLAVDVNAQLYGGIVGSGATNSLRAITGASASGITVDLGRISDPSGVPIAITGVALGGTAELRLQLWMGSANNWADAVTGGAARADSGLFSNPTGGDGSPPALPKNLTGLPEMHLTATVVPEPSTLVLAGLGAVALLAYRRRTN